jgi:hypothetical protein
MDKSQRLIFYVLVVLTTSIGSYAQEIKKVSCDLPFEIKTVDAHNGRSDGSVQFVSDTDDKSRFKIFLLNKGEQHAKKEISTRKVSNLSEGLYEFIIVDTRNKGCFKEVSVRIPGANKN